MSESGEKSNSSLQAAKEQNKRFEGRNYVIWKFQKFRVCRGILLSKLTH